MSFAAPAMMQELGLSEIQWGWILAAFTAGYAAFQFPGGIFGDSYGPRKALTIIAALWAVTTILTVFFTGLALGGGSDGGSTTHAERTTTGIQITNASPAGIRRHGA